MFNPITLVLVQNLSSMMLGNNKKNEVEIKDVELWVIPLGENLFRPAASSYDIADRIVI